MVAVDSMIEGILNTSCFIQHLNRIQTLQVEIIGWLSFEELEMFDVMDIISS